MVTIPKFLRRRPVPFIPEPTALPMMFVSPDAANPGLPVLYPPLAPPHEKPCPPTAQDSVVKPARTMSVQEAHLLTTGGKAFFRDMLNSSVKHV